MFYGIGGRKVSVWAAALVAGAVLAAGGLTAEVGDDKAVAGGEAMALPAAQTSGGMALTEALAKRRTIRTLESRPLSAEQVAQLCWAAQGITQSEQGFRTAPSALHLYPLTAFVVDARGAYEYQPKAHALRRLEEVTPEQFKKAAGQEAVTAAPVCLVLAIDVEHMKPRCGDKAEQYSLLEAGHVAQNVLLQATALGLGAVPVGGLDEKKVAEAMKLPARLRPVYLLPVGYPKTK